MPAEALPRNDTRPGTATTMKAFVYDSYGPPEVVQLREVAKPTPKDDEVLIRIRATTVTSADFRGRTLEVPFGFGILSRLVFGVFKPRQPILGSELAGDVEAVGTKVHRFKVGDPVVAFGDAGMGCHAEYRTIRQDGSVVAKPANLSYEEAAALSFGGTTALHFLRRANVQPGDKVLINGASGAVGTACVQLARHLGAEVTAVCSGNNVDLMKALGAAHVIDYTKEDFTKNGQTYDVIVDTVGTAPFARSKSSLREGGRLALVFATLPDLLRSPLVSLASKKKVIGGVALGSRADLQTLADLASAGVYKPVIGSRYSFEQLPEAHRHVEAGHKRGNLVITLQG